MYVSYDIKKENQFSPSGWSLALTLDLTVNKMMSSVLGGFKCILVPGRPYRKAIAKKWARRQSKLMRHLTLSGNILLIKAFALS